MILYCTTALRPAPKIVSNLGVAKSNILYLIYHPNVFNRTKTISTLLLVAHYGLYHPESLSVTILFRGCSPVAIHSCGQPVAGITWPHGPMSINKANETNKANGANRVNVGQLPATMEEWEKEENRIFQLCQPLPRLPSTPMPIQCCLRCLLQSVGTSR